MVTVTTSAIVVTVDDGTVNASLQFAPDKPSPPGLDFRFVREILERASAPQACRACDTQDDRPI